MRTKSGIVTSKSGDKSIVVTVHTYENHPIYKKRFRKSSKFHAHDEANTAQVGDEVVIVESKPISKRKRWTVMPATANDNKAPTKKEAA